MTQLESGAIRHMEDQLMRAAEEVLGDQRFEVSATQHAPGEVGPGVESVIVEVTVDVDDRELQNELMDHAYQEFVGGPGNLIHQAVQESHDRLRRYGSANEYSVEPIIDSFTGVEVREADDTLTIGYGWDHVASAYQERGTSPHRIEGNPILSFIWENPPQWAREQFEQEGDGVRAYFREVTVSGLPEARYVRHGVKWLEDQIGT